MTTIAASAKLPRLAALLPLLALTACASSRFSGSVASPPTYSQPALPAAPPITSAPVTSEPLPPPGGYPVAAAGRANLTMSTNQLAERFGAVAMTLEMPFKDHDDNPDRVQGWSPERSKLLARECLAALAEWLRD